MRLTCMLQLESVSCCQATAAERTAEPTCASDGNFQDAKCELLSRAHVASDTE